MMRFFFLFLLLSLLVLAACGQAAKSTNYVPPNTPGGRLCVTQCREAEGYCDQDCGVKTRQCVTKAQARALDDYDQYSRQQFKNREPMDLRPRDFERMGPCDAYKKSCKSDCEERYQSCYEKCGGTVDVTSSCQFLCF